MISLKMKNTQKKSTRVIKMIEMLLGTKWAIISYNKNI